MYITAELDDSYVEKFARIKHNKGLSQLQIVKAALDNYFAQELTNAEIQHQKQAWLDAGFIACAEGAEDGSVNYKQQLNEYLDEKHPKN